MLVKERPHTRFETAAGRWMLLEDDTTCDCAWKLEPHEPGAGSDALEDGVALAAMAASPFPRPGTTCFD